MEITTVGEALAEARTKAGLSVDEVSERTKVREKVIRGIEQDDYDACGGDLFARGYVRVIAGCVGVDAQPLIRLLDEAHAAGSPLASPATTASATTVSVTPASLEWELPFEPEQSPDPESLVPEPPGMAAGPEADAEPDAEAGPDVGAEPLVPEADAEAKLAEAAIGMSVLERVRAALAAPDPAGSSPALKASVPEDSVPPDPALEEPVAAGAEPEAPETQEPQAEPQVFEPAATLTETVARLEQPLVLQHTVIKPGPPIHPSLAGNGKRSGQGVRGWGLVIAAVIVAAVIVIAATVHLP